jgi:hypothetical protein
MDVMFHEVTADLHDESRQPAAPRAGAGRDAERADQELIARLRAARHDRNRLRLLAF